MPPSNVVQLFVPEEIRTMAYYMSLAFSRKEHKDERSQKKYSTAIDNINARLLERGRPAIQNENVIPFYKKGMEDPTKHAPAGYIVRAADEIIVTYRGTETLSEAKHDLQIKKGKLQLAGQSEPLSVHAGILTEFELSKDSMDRALAEARAKAKDSGSPELPVKFTGHSLGGALSQIAAMHYAAQSENGMNGWTPEDKDRMQVVTFGSPRVFKADAARVYGELGLDARTMRVTQAKDVIPKLPPGFMGYVHSGQSINIYYNSKMHSTATYRQIASYKTFSRLKISKFSRGEISRFCPSHSYTKTIVTTSIKALGQLCNSAFKEFVNMKKSLSNITSNTPRIGTALSNRKRSKQNKSENHSR